MRAKVKIAQPQAAAVLAPVRRDMNERVLAAQIDNLFRVLRPTQWAGFVAALLLGFILYEFFGLESWRFTLWTALHLINTFIRSGINAVYWRVSPEQRQRIPWGPIFTACTFSFGLTWGVGSVAVLAPDTNEAELLMLLDNCAYASGSITLLGNYLPAYFANIAPVCIPLAISSLQHRDPFHLAFAVLGIGFMLVMGVLAWASNRNLRRSLRLDIEKLDLIESLQQQNELVEQASRAKSRFLAAASHDLRQPVHALGMFVGALREQPLNPQSERLLDQVSGSVDAMDSLFASLLDISKLDAGVVRPNLLNFRVGPIIERVCGDFAIEAERKGLALTDCSTGLTVRTDPVLLESLLRNLVSNAVRYTDRGRILVGCRRGAKIRIDVIDTGRGIAKKDIEKIFEEFYQVGNAERDRSQGLGLGLAIVKRVATLIDCELEIDSRLHVGTRVTIHVPLANGEPAPESPDFVYWDNLTLSHTLFVIDDEASIREGMQCLLESWGHKVYAADSGQSILKLASELPVRPDLIICDFRLRDGENGIEVMNRLRDEYNENIPGMLITGDTAPDRLAEAVQSDFMILHKPISAAKLRAAMRTAIARAKAPSEDERQMEMEG